jgi:hypothetical protein
MLVELGREQAKAPIRMRLQRFVDYYPTCRTPAMGGRWRWICGIQTVSHCAFRPVRSRSQRKEMSRDSKDLIVGLDIGTSKIVALVAELTPEGR